MTDRTAVDPPRAIFRSSVLRRYAAGDVHEEPLRDVSGRQIVLLWLAASVLGGGLLAVAVSIASQTR